jgi:glycosyltransferase involved in cell wall biosynthesis
LRCLTILIPALNEEKNILLTVNEILPVARRTLDAFEIILVNDGSSDRTGEIMDALAEGNSELQVVHHSARRGLGWAFREGIARARFDWLTLIPGDNAFNIEGLKRLFEATGSADLVISFRTDQMQKRSLFRMCLSCLFTFIMGHLFGYRLRDFHSAVVYPVRVLRQLELRSDGYTYQLEVLVKLLGRGVLFVEVPVSMNPEMDGSSQSVCLKTLLDMGRMVWHLFRRRP